jgi:Zn-dependent protease
MEEINLVQRLIIWAFPVLLAITLHEVAHGRMALQLGDSTAKSLGRLSLNPLRHVDPIGTLVVPIVLFFVGGFVFGWAKPVPVDFRRLRKPKRDMALVALAGPGANLIMAVAWAVVMGISYDVAESVPWAGVPLFYMGIAGININVVLCVLNLLPVPPLDGSRVLSGLLPDAFGAQMARLEPFGLVILLLLLATGLLGTILTPPIVWLREVIYSVFFG